MQDAGNVRLAELVADLELPDHAYESAKRRYEDLGAWFERPESMVAKNDPHIFVQGSFALGTAIRPLKDDEEYDLDLSCRLRTGAHRTSHSQKDIKDLVGNELEQYRVARRIQERLEPKHRCWRLQYQDSLRFHMDVVPCIPADETRRRELSALMEGAGLDRRLAGDVASDAVWITDDRKPNFDRIDLNWLGSNPEGYVRWFQSRMEGTDRALKAEARVDDVPLYRRKAPLQQVVQLLKRHRDVMFDKHTEAKPVSIIITTIAGQACLGGQSLAATMRMTLVALAGFRRSNTDVVLNPVDPRENFADGWRRAECVQLQLKRNCHNWIDQACRDFEVFLDATDPDLLVEQAGARLRVTPSKNRVTAALGLAAGSYAPRRVHITSTPPKPWLDR